MPLTSAKFRAMALDLFEAVEGSHMGHPDFRIGGKIFASLGADETWGMVKLTPEQQAKVIKAEPDAYRPASGAWGRGGATIVTLKHAKVASVRAALASAWKNIAPADVTGEPKRPVKKNRQGATRALPSSSVSAGLGKRKGLSNSSPRKREPR